MTHEAPRWKPQTDPNIDGKGVFGVELGNFSTLPQVGDTVTVVFTSNAHGQRGVLSESISMLPWYRFPLILNLQEQEIPAPPANIRLISTGVCENRLEWQAETGLTYTIYRRDLADTLADGRQKMLYSRIAEQIVNDYFVDSGLTAGRQHDSRRQFAGNSKHAVIRYFSLFPIDRFNRRTRLAKYHPQLDGSKQR